MHAISLTWKSLLCLLMAGIGVVFFRRIAEGNLFLFAFPSELPPLAGELSKARELGRMLFWSPIPISAGIWLFLMTAKFKVCDGYSLRSRVGITLIVLQGLALVATVLDAWSTSALISQFGIDGEVHPGIASFCYMFGRTAGTIFGKMFQWICMQFIVAAVSVRWRIVILVIYCAAGMLASAWNFSQLAEFG
ncbi:hypothetical protein K2Y11_13620 [bacterium]|nr:hypothetical protein [bacterium]